MGILSASRDISLKEIAEIFDKLEEITSRTAITALVADLFKKTPVDVIDKTVYLLQGTLWPEWKGHPELGVGEKMLIKAIALATQARESLVENLYKSMGDLGRVVEKLRQDMESKSRTASLLAYVSSAKELTVSDVYEKLTRIASAQGEGSKDIKLKILAGLLSEARPKEARFIVRFVEGQLRLGVGEATIMDALAIVYGGGISSRDVIERAYNLYPDLGSIARTLATKGIDEVRKIKIKVGVPIKPMLAERLSDPREILDKAGGEAYVEYKYDGERAQIHKSSDEVTIFSRRLEDITRQYPDVVEYVVKQVRAREAIVEGEIVAYSPETGELKPFQELMQRKRKHEIHVALKEVPVKVFLFDLLYADGEDYTLKPLPARRAKLEEIVEETDTFKIAEYISARSPDELERFFFRAIEEGAEGVMAKAIHSKSIYQAGMRGWLWIKYKRDYKSEMADTVDLVVVGAFYGRGRRGGKLGTLLMASYNPERNAFETVCKVGSGFKDEDLDKMHDLLKPYAVSEKPFNVVASIEPDLWVKPSLVAEIIGSELTLSPIHTCGYGSIRLGTGISIRFPRFIRWRPDKSPEEATTTQELVEMYKRQLRKISEK